MGLVSSYQNLPSEANTSVVSIPPVKFDEASGRAAIYASISGTSTNLMISSIFVTNWQFALELFICCRDLAGVCFPLYLLETTSQLEPQVPFSGFLEQCFQS